MMNDWETLKISQRTTHVRTHKQMGNYLFTSFGSKLWDFSDFQEQIT